MLARINRIVCAAALSTLAAVTTACAAEDNAKPALLGSHWLSEAAHTRVTIDRLGTVDRKVGKNLHIEFLSEDGGTYTVKINWWNESESHNVVEYAVMLPETDNTYTYIEANHPDGSGFPGIVGHGVFHLVGDNNAVFTQSGWLKDGSASGFTTSVKRVDGPPEIPVAPSYPKPE